MTIPETSEARTIFEPLSDNLMAALASLLTSRTYSAGETIMQRGEPGGALFILRAGAAEVFIRDEEGVKVPLARFGPGTYFGEMSLLTGEPVSADVVAMQESVISILPQEDAERVLSSVPAFGRHLAVTLAHRLEQADLSIWDVHRRQQALQQFLRHGYRDTAMVGESRHARGLRERAAEFSEHDEPVLIVGEPGVGKTTMARRIHEASPRAERPLIEVDCSVVESDDARELLFGSSDPSAVGRYAPRLGYVHLADGGTLLLEHIDRLPLQLQADLATFLAESQLATTGRSIVDVRVVGTALSSAPANGQASNFAPALAVQLFDTLVEMPPLRQHKRDVNTLAQHFLGLYAKVRQEAPKTLTADAMRALISCDYAHGNIEELRDSLERAAQLSDGKVIGAEHIFLGPQATQEAGQYDLFNSTWLANVAHSGLAMQLLRGVTFAVFGLIIAVCLLAPDSRIGAHANAAVWSLWWPLLLLSFLSAGRIWCAVCPISHVGGLAQRLKCLQQPPPQWMKVGGPAIVLTGFVAIVWVEYVAQMHSHPFATGLLLITLMALAAGVGVIFQRHCWCRYLCPLGGLGATTSLCSPIRLRANRDVCATQCTEHECYKGTETAPGCPMFHHALFVDGSQHCKLCLECLKVCPARSLRLFVQAPLKDLWTAGRISPLSAAFTVTLAGVALALALSQWPGSSRIALDTVEKFSLACVGTLGLGLLALAVFIRFQKERTSATPLWARLCLTLMPLAWAVLLCYHVGTSKTLRNMVVAVSSGVNAPAAQSSMLGVVYIAVMLAAAVMTAVTFWRVYVQHIRPGPRNGKLAWALCLLAAITYGLVGFASYLRGDLYS